MSQVLLSPVISYSHPSAWEKAQPQRHFWFQAGHIARCTEYRLALLFLLTHHAVCSPWLSVGVCFHRHTRPMIAIRSSTLCLFVGPQSALYKIFHLNIYLPSSTSFPLQFLRQLLRMLLDLFKLPWPADHVQKRPQIMPVVIWVLTTSLASLYPHT